jgi:hypothetical protein
MELQMHFGLTCLTMQVMTRPSLYICDPGLVSPTRALVLRATAVFLYVSVSYISCL